MQGKRILILLACLALGLGVSSAQDYRATVQGVVTDSTQAVIVGATVTLRNDATGVEAAKQTNELGRYVFGYVEPGAYTIRVAQPGFGEFVQQNIQVRVRSDVTVNASLAPGAVTEAVTVSASAVTLQFNTSTKELTIDRKQLMDLPVMARNPFTLALLDPAVENRYPVDGAPYLMWAPSSLNVGGRTSRQNDLLIDGSPVQIGPKGSYTPTMDAVQEFSVQQNSVDAEFGHSAGGIVSLSMRAGTNDIHGTAYYFGRNPALNAVSNAITRGKSEVRNHNWGGTAGGPIKKNQLFTFFAYEGWKTKEPLSSYFTLPTESERIGDFSKSLNAAGGMRVIYNPYSTQLDPVTNAATRQPFAGNVIPKTMQDPTAQLMMNDIWGPNNPGDSITGINNFKVSYAGLLDYWNFSNRTDWNISDKLKVFGRYSRFHTQLDQDDYTPNHSLAMPTSRAGVMKSRNIAADAVYTPTPTTVVNLRFSYTGFADDYSAPARAIGEEGLARYWPSNQWYKLYLDQLPAVYYPRINIGNSGFGTGWFWIQQPHNYNYSGKISMNAGRHYMKAGAESRIHRMFGIFPDLMNFSFPAAMTADTFINPDTNLSGDAYATFLLGALDGDSRSNYTAAQNLAVSYYGAFFHDDFKVSRNVTLNLGLRYEYESAPTDARDRYTRYLDLTDPIPEMQASPPIIPDWINQMRGKPAQFNGAWIFADSEHRAQFNAQKLNLMPRAGIAIRVNDRTAIQAGYARYIIPNIVVQDGTIGGARFPGFSVQTNALPSIAGVPSAALSDPFPAGENPLQPVVGKSMGRYTNLGNGWLSWRQQDYRNGINDRINITLQRELPWAIKADVTWFMHFGHNLDYGVVWDEKPINMADPNLVYTHKGAVYEGVANPFYNYLTPDKFPGQLRNWETISVLDLLRPYPQYGDLSEQHPTGMSNRYKALQLRLQREHANGLSLLWAYNYNRQSVTYFMNDLTWYNWQANWRKGENPRHRMTLADTYDLPFGKGRPLLNNAHKLVNAIFGGWSTSSLLTINSGEKSLFWDWTALVGDPRISNPTPKKRFNTAAFAPLPDFTPRTSPLLYDGVQGPGRWNLDTTLSKTFPIKERFNLEFRMEAYNLTNSFIWGNPDASFYSSTFGQCTSQANRGREMQYTLRLIF